MAARTLMPTASAIDGGPETGAIHHRILYDVKYSDHFFVYFVLFTVYGLQFTDDYIGGRNGLLAYQL
jgi:hypothetical protein